MMGDLVKKAPGPPGVDFAIRNRLSRLKERKNNTSLPPSQPPPKPLLLPPPLPPPPPPSFPFNLPPPPPPPPDSILPPATNHIFSPQPPLPTPSSSFRFPTQPTVPSNKLFSSQTQILTREEEETKNEKPLDDNKIYELPETPKIELADRLANVLGAEGEEILENNFLRDTELEDKNIKEIKEEHEFDKTKDAFDDGAVLPLLDFFYDGEHLSEYFRRAFDFLSLNGKNIGFVDFLCCDRCQNFMANSSLSIHVESGNIFYQNSIQMIVL